MSRESIGLAHFLSNLVFFIISFAKSFFFQILCGVAYCHANLVLHRDLKPCNILVTESGKIKITDFGLGRTYNVPMPPYSPGVGYVLCYRWSLSNDP